MLCTDAHHHHEEKRRFARISKRHSQNVSTMFTLTYSKIRAHRVESIRSFRCRCSSCGHWNWRSTTRTASARKSQSPRRLRSTSCAAARTEPSVESERLRRPQVASPPVRCRDRWSIRVVQYSLSKAAFWTHRMQCVHCLYLFSLCHSLTATR